MDNLITAFPSRSVHSSVFHFVCVTTEERWWWPLSRRHLGFCCFFLACCSPLSPVSPLLAGSALSLLFLKAIPKAAAPFSPSTALIWPWPCLAHTHTHRARHHQPSWPAECRRGGGGGGGDCAERRGSRRPRRKRGKTPPPVGLRPRDGHYVITATSYVLY